MSDILTLMLAISFLFYSGQIPKYFTPSHSNSCSSTSIPIILFVKLALVTGSAQRIGRCLALFLAERGYSLALHYHQSGQQALQAQTDIKKRGVACEIFKANLAQSAEVAQLIPQVLKRMGPIDLLINNVSVFNSPNFMASTEKQFDHDVAVNLRAPFFLTQAFAAQVAKGTSKSKSYPSLIVNMLDTRITKVQTDYCIYTLTKHALFHLTCIAAKSLAPRIRVNAIAPGPALPPLGTTQARLDKSSTTTPLGAASPPSTLAQGLGYLLDAHTVTGQVLYIDSGQHL